MVDNIIPYDLISLDKRNDHNLDIDSVDLYIMDHYRGAKQQQKEIVKQGTPV